MNPVSLAAESEVFEVDLPPEPYPGLRPFEKHEWPIFFGRELIAAEVIDRLIRNQFVALHGDSGCGKSSLIRAGVMPRLERDHARGGATWRTTAMLPRNAPLRNLAAALACLQTVETEHVSEVELRRILNLGTKAAELLSRRLRRHENDYICILVDQFEEIFQYGVQGNESEAQQFIDVLVGLQRARAPGLHVVLTLRSEFIGSCAHYQGLAETINDTLFLLPLMDKRALMRAVREPARLYGGSANQDFAEHVVSSGFAQDELPLLQHALMRLKQAAAARSASGDERGWHLTLELYDDVTGGRGGAKLLNDHADSVTLAVGRMASPPEEGLTPTKILERALKALTDIDAQGRKIRRPLQISQLAAETGVGSTALLEVLRPLCAEGVSFLRIYGGSPFHDTEIVDFSHEALIRTWATLNDWILQEAADGRSYERLRYLAEEFDGNPNLTLGRHETAQRVSWWRERTPTAAWTERYGGNKPIVERLLDESQRKTRREKQRFYAAAGLASIVILFSTYMGYEWYEGRAVTARYRTLLESDRKTVDKAIDNSSALTKGFEARNAKIAAPIRKLLEASSSKTLLSEDEYGELEFFASAGSSERIAALSPGRIKPDRSFHESRGLLPLPVRGKRVLSFGDKTTLGTTSKGISIATDAKATVYAPVDGVVVYAGEFRTYGQLLIISPGGGYHIILAGLSYIDVQVGQSVLVGEPVGGMGDGSDKQVLTVEFRKDQQAIDPDPWWDGGDSRTKEPAEMVRAPDPPNPVAVSEPVRTATVTTSAMAGERIAVAGIVSAPGDGVVSLSAALQAELSIAGFVVVEGSVTGTYRIEGAIALGQAKDGTQPIEIEWVVRAPDGKKLGTVLQKNDIPAGSLDGAWGKTAEQAAKSAAGGIVKLLPRAEQP